MAPTTIPFGRIITPFDKRTDAAVSAKGTLIYNSMLSNPDFPTPSPDMPTVQGALNNYIESLASAQSRERTAIIVKNQNRIILIAVLKALANYITFTAQGDVAKLSGTGYDLAKTRSKSPAIEKPINPEVIDGAAAGELIGSVDGVKNVKSYVHQIKANLPSGDTVWTNIFSSSRTCTFTGLESGQRYTVRVGAIGVNNQIVFSDAVTRIAQ